MGELQVSPALKVVQQLFESVHVCPSRLRYELGKSQKSEFQIRSSSYHQVY